MAEQVENAVLEEELEPDDSFAERFKEWVCTELVWYAGSFTAHLVGLSLLLLVSTTAAVVLNNAPTYDAAKVDKASTEDPPTPNNFEIPLPEDEKPQDLTTEMLATEKPAVEAHEAEWNDASDHFEHRGGGMPTNSKEPAYGGMGGFTVMAYGRGAKVVGAGGLAPGVGTGTHAGSGGSGKGFGGRGSGHRKAQLASSGGTPGGERAVGGALFWLAKHQMSDGSWSLTDYRRRCRDGTCTGVSNQHKAEVGATALGLLPFLAAGQTHRSPGPYRANIQAALQWLISHQGRDGDLRGGHNMYSHGLASIALCEAYGLTADRRIESAAQGAINFIIAAQNKTTGGWRYKPGDPGDTSVVGWEVMALKSAQMAGLAVPTNVFDGASRWLDSVKSGYNGSEFAYIPGKPATPTMTSVGLLCRQYLGARRNDPLMTSGMGYLQQNAPVVSKHDLYYWYYATQVMHNINGDEWDKWNRAMRKVLIYSQCRDGCATGSWDPNAPVKDNRGDAGGRLMMTSLSALTLEIYYRFLPLYKVDAELGGGKAAAAAPAAAAPAAAVPPAKAAPSRPAAPKKPAAAAPAAPGARTRPPTPKKP